MNRIFVILFTLCWLTSCMVGPDFKRPQPVLPQKFLSQKPQSIHHHLPLKWWHLYKSNALNELITASLQHNPNLEATEHALQAALENTYAVRGALFPSVSASFAPSRQRTADILTSVLASNEYLYSLYTGQVYVSYTLDVFGGNRRMLEASLAQTETQKHQLTAAYLTLTTNVASAVIQEAALREQISATKEIISSQRRLLQVSNKLFSLGDVARADIAIQQAALAATEANLPPLYKQLAIQRDLLNALTGRYSNDPSTPEIKLAALHLPGEIPTSIPASLLEHRPDIRAAEAQMHAANALVGVAKANRLPNFTIANTNAGTAATTIGTLMDPTTRFWSLAGVIAQPIFDGGNLRHGQRAAEATYRQTAALYRSAVINAVQNVNDALQALFYDQQAVATAYKAYRAAQTSLEITRKQIALGDSSRTALFVTQLTYQQARFNLIQAQANQLTDSVALIQALGGGWQEIKAPFKD